MKIKFNLDDDLPLKKTVEPRNMILIARAVFHEYQKYYSQFFLDECLYKLKMLLFDRINVCQGIDGNETNASKEFHICYY